MNAVELYNQYEDWKRWDQDKFYTIDKSESNYLQIEIGSDSLEGKTVLEIGFGNATKLAWLASRGARVFGTEINTRLCARAASKGINVLPTNIFEVSDEYKEHFDIVMAYDVLEHLSLDEVRQTLIAISAMLRPNGLLIARFPNGRSPLGRTHQYADHTHRSVLSDAIIEYLVRDLQMTLERKSDGYYLHKNMRSIKDFFSNIKCILRSLLNRVFQSLYDVEAPIGPNIIVHLRKHNTAYR